MFEVFPECLKDVGCFISVSSVFEGCFKIVSRVFRECFKSVSRVFQECFKSVMSVSRGLGVCLKFIFEDAKDIT